MYTKRFHEISLKNVKEAGGKGASLGEMTKAKIPVPSGFVVLTMAYEKFLEEADLNVEIEAIMHKTNYKNIKIIARTSKKIRELIHDAKFPKDIRDKIKEKFSELNTKYVAVRSSATAEDSSIASWAGELESYLNISRRALLEAVKDCWSSLFTPRAIFYRFNRKLHKKKNICCRSNSENDSIRNFRYLFYSQPNY